MNAGDFPSRSAISCWVRPVALLSSRNVCCNLPISRCRNANQCSASSSSGIRLPLTCVMVIPIERDAVAKRLGRNATLTGEQPIPLPNDAIDCPVPSRVSLAAKLASQALMDCYESVRLHERAKNPCTLPIGLKLHAELPHVRLPALHIVAIVDPLALDEPAEKRANIWFEMQGRLPIALIQPLMQRRPDPQLPSLSFVRIEQRDEAAELHPLMGR